MQRLKAYGIKLIGVGIITASIYGIFLDASIWSLLLITVIVATLSFVGDLFILPRVNKVFAVIGDFTFYFILFYFLGGMVVNDTMSLLLAAFTAAYFGAFGDAFFHIYMIDYVFDERYVNPFPGKFQTEFAQETDLKSVADEEKSLGKNEDKDDKE